MILNVLSVSLSMSAVILVLTLMRKHINKKYSARVMCMIWLFVALRLLIPVQIDLPVSKVNLELNMDQIITEVDFPAIKTPEFNNTIQLDQTIKVEETVMPAANFSISWHDAVTCVWLAGAVYMLVKQVLAYCSISKWLKRNSVYEKTIDGFKVYLSSALPEPLSFGTFKSSIYLTEQFRTDNWVLNHELMHCKHYDGLMMWIAALVKSIHWFNPLVYYMDKQWEANRELYCDEAVLKDKTKSERIEYMVTLYDAAEAMTDQRLRFASGLLDGEHQMVERFKQIKRSESKRKGRVLVLLLSVFIVLGSCLIGCSSKGDLLNEFIQHFKNDELLKTVSGKVRKYGNASKGFIYSESTTSFNIIHTDITNLQGLPLVKSRIDSMNELIESSELSENEIETVNYTKENFIVFVEAILPDINKKLDEYQEQIIDILKTMEVEKIDKLDTSEKDSIEAKLVIYLEDGSQLTMKIFNSGQLMVTLGNGIINTKKECYRCNTSLKEMIKYVLNDYNGWSKSEGEEFIFWDLFETLADDYLKIVNR